MTDETDQAELVTYDESDYIQVWLDEAIGHYIAEEWAEARTAALIATAVIARAEYVRN